VVGVLFSTMLRNVFAEEVTTAFLGAVADGLVGSVFWAPQWLKPQTKLEDESFLNAKNFWHPAKWKWIVVAGCSPGPLFSRVYLSNFFHLNLS